MVDMSANKNVSEGKKLWPVVLLKSVYKNYGLVVVSVAIVTVIGKIVEPYFDLTNIAFIYLLPVLMSAVLWGRGPSLFSSLLGALTFNFFFVPPIYTFAVGNIQHVFVLAVFLLVAIVTGTTATQLKRAGEKATEREKRTLTLYTLSREIAEKNDLDQVLQTFADKVAETMNGDAVVLTHDPESKDTKSFSSTNGRSSISEIESSVAQWVLEHGEPSDPKLAMFAEERSLFYFPIKAEEKTLAVLGIRLRERDMKLSRDQRQLIETFSNLAAVAIARLQAAKEVEQAKWLAESEKLHRTLLNSISHDFRTPLASITGAVTSLLTEGVAYSSESKKIFLETIKEEAQRMNRFIENLLDMARLESGTLRPNMKWCDVQDIIGVALRETGDVLTGHPIWVDVPPEPLSVKVDFILIEQVLINLLENAAKYSPEGGAISISAQTRGDTVVISVSDLGPLIPKAEQESVFDKFYRAHSSQQTGGTGLGLSICRGIVEAHGGRIWLESSAENGNKFIFTVPVPEEVPTGQTGNEEQG